MRLPEVVTLAVLSMILWAAVVYALNMISPAADVDSLALRLIHVLVANHVLEDNSTE